MNESTEPVGSPPEQSRRGLPRLRSYPVWLIGFVVFMIAIRLVSQWAQHRALIGAFDMFKEPQLYIALAAAIPLYYFMAWLLRRKPEWFTKALWGNRPETWR